MSRTSALGRAVVLGCPVPHDLPPEQRRVYIVHKPGLAWPFTVRVETRPGRSLSYGHFRTLEAAEVRVGRLREALGQC
jgi:hypothetical protein